MPITINGTGSITGISAGGLPDLSITTADIADNAVTYAKIGTTEQGQLCKAWVNFNGTGVVAIRASYNVSSITDNGVGDYTVNFTTALADANYATITTGARRAASYNSIASYNDTNNTSSANGARIEVIQANDARVDPFYVSVAIFR